MRRLEPRSSGPTAKTIKAGAAAIALLVAVGLAVRWTTLDLMLFDFDEGIASIYAYQFVQGGIWPTRGVKTSLGFYNPPLFIWLIAVPHAFSLLPTVAVGFLQGLTALSLLVLLRLLLNRALVAAAVAVALFASLAPGPMLLTGRLWGHAVIPAFSCFAVACVLALASSPRHRLASLVLPLAISFAQQCHFSGALLLVSAAWALWWLRARPDWRYLAAGAGIAALTYIPFLVEEWQSDFASTRAILAITTGQSDLPRTPGPLWRAAFFSLSDMGGLTALQDAFGTFLRSLSVYRLLRVLLGVGLVAAAGLSIVRLWQTRHAPSADPALPQPPLSHAIVAGLVWCAVPLIFFTVLRVETVPAYWLVALPGPYLLAGAGVEAWCRGEFGISPRRARTAAIVAAVVACTGFGILLVRYNRLMANPDPALVQYPPFREQRDAVAFICDNSAPHRVLLTQDSRTPAAGLDYQVLYLIAAREGNGLRFDRESPGEPEEEYLLHRRSLPLPPAVAGGGWNQRDFGLLSVYWRPVRR